MVQEKDQADTDTLVGYRLVRLIGSGGRSEVFLAKPAAGGPERPPVALKVFRPLADPEDIGREVHALLAAPAAALARLDDVATTPDGRVCLVLDHLPGLTLDRLLTVRGRIDAAEVVTVAATATATLQALHDVGLAHPLVRPSCVRFDGRGRPVLLGLGALAELPRGVAAVATRRDAAVGLTGFLRSLLAFLDPADAAAASAPALLAEFTSATVARPFPASLASLEASLFAWAAAGPVRGAVPDPAARPDPVAIRAPEPVVARRPVSVAASGRGLPLTAAAPEDVGAVAPGRFARLRAVVGRRAPVSLLGGAVGSALGQVRRLRSVRLPSVRPRPVRRRERSGLALHLPGGRPLLVGAGLVVVLAGGGLAALSVPSAKSGAAAVRPADGTVEPVDPEGDTGAVAAGAGPGPGAASAVDGDDPAAAVLELLRRREDCLADRSVLCLDGVDQPGSVAMAADGYRIRQLQAEPSAAPTAGAGPAAPLAAELRERTGDAALVVLSAGAGAGVNAQPASALVIKGEAGWRLRELFDY